MTDAHELAAAHFDRDYYLASNADVREAGIDPFGHYIVDGWREGRDPVAWFSTSGHLAAHPDLAAQGIEPFGHFLAHTEESGAELRRPTLEVDGESGTAVFVTHDLETGGAQRLLASFMRWVRQSTRHDVILIALKGGRDTHRVGSEFPLLNLDGATGTKAQQLVRDFIPANARFAFLSTVVSGGALDLLPSDLPVTAHVHEMAQVLKLHEAELDALKSRRVPVIAGSAAVQRDLVALGMDPSQISVFEAFVEAASDRNGPSEFTWQTGALRVVGCGVCHWRKWPEVMVELARELDERNEDAAIEFVWIGDGPTRAECERMVRRYGLRDRVRFVGHRQDAEQLIAEADLFLLSSVEDPFPLVGLAALREGLPVLAFSDTGGVAELVAAEELGVTVELGDIKALADAVSALAHDETTRNEIGERGRRVVASRYAAPRAAACLFSMVRDRLDLLPYVSVIVPNYNYEQYLEQRLDSIADQTFGDYELIVLDDASTDNSVDVIEDWLKLSHGELVRFDTNSGSPFRQWFNGIDRARSHRIWIAEADDVAQPTFLEAATLELSHPNVGFVWCNSDVIDGTGEVVGNHEPYLSSIAGQRYARSFVASDQDEVVHGLAIANTVPNVSAALFENPELSPAEIDDIISFRLAGDWAFYLRAMHNRDVAFIDDQLNQHRRHKDTVTHGTEGGLRYLSEVATVQALAAHLYTLTDEAAERAQHHLRDEVARFGHPDDVTIEPLELNGLSAPRPPSVCVVCPDLSPGGGQLWAIRLAENLASRGARVCLFNVGNLPAHAEVLAMVHPRVRVLGPDLSRNRSFGTVLSEDGYDVVHSAIWWADRFVEGHYEQLDGRPWIVTTHGCYESILDEPDIDPTFSDRVPRMLARVDHWITTADKNERVFEQFRRPDNLSRVQNGVPAPEVAGPDREALGIPEDATVVLIASRAIESKGWRPLCEAIVSLNADDPKFHLVAVGEGPIADELRTVYARRSDIQFVGQVRNLADWIRVCDLGCLPTTFVGESFPLVVLDFMAQGKPVVATDWGSIADMLAGPWAEQLLVDPTADLVPQLRSALATLADPSVATSIGSGLKDRFDAEYTVARMVDAYLDVYTSVEPSLIR